MRRYFILALFFTGFIFSSVAQSNSSPIAFEHAAAKPYKVITTGSNVSIRSNSTIKSILVWTSEGKRIVENKDVNAAVYNFRLQSGARYYFVRILMKDGSSFSEKIAVRQH